MYETSKVFKWAEFFFIIIRAEATVIIQVLRMLKKLLGCDWIHHKFLKLNFLCKIRAYKSQYQ